MSKIQSALERAKSSERSSAKALARKQASERASLTGQFLAATPNSIDLSMARRVPVDESVFAEYRLLADQAEERHPALGAYRMLRTRMMQVMRANDWRVLGVSSVGKNEGKTFTSINLAITIAAEIGQDAILVDLDLQRPSVHRYLGIDSSNFQSLRNYLKDDVDDLADLIVCPNIDRLSCILSSEPLANSSDILSSASGKRFFSGLRGRIFDEVVIVVDLPPLLATDDALAVAPMLDALLLVVAEGQTERSDLSEARQLLGEFNVIGTVLNRSNERDSRRTSYY